MNKGVHSSRLLAAGAAALVREHAGIEDDVVSDSPLEVPSVRVVAEAYHTAVSPGVAVAVDVAEVREARVRSRWRVDATDVYRTSGTWKRDGHDPGIGPSVDSDGRSHVTYDSRAGIAHETPSWKIDVKISE